MTEFEVLTITADVAKIRLNEKQEQKAYARKQALEVMTQTENLMFEYEEGQERMKHVIAFALVLATLYDIGGDVWRSIEVEEERNCEVLLLAGRITHLPHLPRQFDPFGPSHPSIIPPRVVELESPAGDARM